MLINLNLYKHPYHNPFQFLKLDWDWFTLKWYWYLRDAIGKEELSLKTHEYVYKLDFHIVLCETYISPWLRTPRFIQELYPSLSYIPNTLSWHDLFIREKMKKYGLVYKENDVPVIVSGYIDTDKVNRLHDDPHNYIRARGMSAPFVFNYESKIYNGVNHFDGDTMNMIELDHTSKDSSFIKMKLSSFYGTINEDLFLKSILSRNGKHFNPLKNVKCAVKLDYKG